MNNAIKGLAFLLALNSASPMVNSGVIIGTGGREALNEPIIQTIKGDYTSDWYKSTIFYTVKKGDNLSKIAEYFYGDEGKWRTIYEMNKNFIGENPDFIKTGTELKTSYEVGSKYYDDLQAQIFKESGF